MSETSPVESVETFVVKMGDGDGDTLPGTDYYLSSIGIVYPKKTEQLLLKVTAEDGTVGWGEVQAPVVPEVPRELIDRLLGPLILGTDPRQTDQIWETMYRTMNVRGHFSGFMIDAMAGIDIALWDLKGKLLGHSVSELLGGRRRDRLEAYVTGPGDAMLEHLESGFSGIKLGAGRETEPVTEAIDTITERGFDPSHVLVDHHWGLDSADEAIRLGRKLESLGVRFLEAPLTPEDIAGASRVTDALDVSIALGESLRTTHEFSIRLSRDAFDIAQPDINRTGLTEGRKIANLVDTHGRPVAPHIGGSLGIAMAATWHLSSSISNFLIQEHQVGRMELSNRFLTPELDVSDGRLSVPEGPGLGVEINQNELLEYVTERQVVSNSD